jgi:hypothetical protein
MDDRMRVAALQSRLRAAHAETGSLLVESLITAALLTVVLGAIYTLSNGALGIASKDQERSHVIRDAQTGVHRMTRELRSSYNVVSWTSTSIQADVLTASGNVRVTYNCGVAHPTLQNTSRCTRTVGSTSEVILDHVASAAFTYELEGSPSTPRYADIRLRIKAAGDLKEGHGHQIELHDGVYMRNRNG